MKENALKRYTDLLKNIDNEKPIFDKDGEQKILIVDGTNTFIRCISVNTTISETGLHVGGLTGFLASIGKAIKILRPNRVIIIFDGKGGSLRRKKLFEAYKAQRNPRKNLVSKLFNTKEDELEAISFEMKRLSLYLKNLPLQTLVVDNVEADDVIAFLCTDIFRHDEKYIMSTDKDFYQLVNRNTFIWSPIKKQIVDEQLILTEFGIPACNFIIVKSLQGDSADNIPGINRIGEKTIQKNFCDILENKISIEDFILFCEKFNKISNVNQKIVDNKIQLLLNYNLMQLEDVDISSHTKIIISNAIKQPITRLNKFILQKLILEDGINTQIKDFENWIKEIWWFLDIYAKELNK